MECFVDTSLEKVHVTGCVENVWLQVPSSLLIITLKTLKQMDEIYFFQILVRQFIDLKP